MYESYPWPGAHTLRQEAKLITKCFQELLTGVLEKIKKSKEKPCRI